MQHDIHLHDGPPDLRIAGISLSIGGFHILRNVSLDVARNSITGLIGPNGSGKTTLFNVASGYMCPQAGRVELHGADVTGLSIQERCRRGMVRTFQTPKVFEEMTVLENVMVGTAKMTRSSMLGDMFGVPNSSRQKRQMLEMAEAECERFGLERIKSTLAKNLTGGQRRILEIARANVGQPRILMLDEPSSGLNIEEIDNLKDWIRQLNSDGMSIFLVSHDMDLLNVVEHIYVLNFGEILTSGTVEAVKNNRQVHEVYLGV